jgi:hypothetical protein
MSLEMLDGNVSLDEAASSVTDHKLLSIVLDLLGNVEA